MYRGVGRVETRTRGSGAAVGARLACDAVELLGAIDDIGGGPVDAWRGTSRTSRSRGGAARRRRTSRPARAPPSRRSACRTRPQVPRPGSSRRRRRVSHPGPPRSRRARDRDTIAAGAEALAAADRQPEAAAGLARPVEPPPAGGDLVRRVRGGPRARIRRGRSNAPGSSTDRGAAGDTQPTKSHVGGLWPVVLASVMRSTHNAPVRSLCYPSDNASERRPPTSAPRLARRTGPPRRNPDQAHPGRPPVPEPCAPDRPARRPRPRG